LQSKGLEPNPGRKVAPWFSYPQRETRRQKIIFGHWAALQGQTEDDTLYALDTGCVWGQQLSMFCLDSGEWYRCDCS
jgi:bis(5'-nucleosyl)-tetraphosphatase (symmetrical)